MPGVEASAHWDLPVEERAVGAADLEAAALRVVYPSRNLPPGIEVTAPPQGTTLPSGSNVTLAADAFDLDGTISKVEFYVGSGGDRQRLGEDTTAPYSTLWRTVADGYYVVRAVAIDDGGLRTIAETQVRIGTPRLPYHGKPSAIPGKVEAEDFDLGANGDAYFDNSQGNAGGGYRFDTDADLQRTTDLGGGYNIGWTGVGEWLEYTVEVAVAGDYDLYVRIASQTGDGVFHVEFGGIDKTGPMTVPKTGGWQSWETVSTTVSLDAGVQVMRWRNASERDKVNLNYFEILPAGTGICGNGVCETGEDCSSCPRDCDSITEGWPVNRYCCGNGVAEAPEGDGLRCDGNY